MGMNLIKVQNVITLVKNCKISWVQWFTAETLTTWEAEIGMIMI
jgi:hypothetical protein